MYVISFGSLQFAPCEGNNSWGEGGSFYPRTSVLIKNFDQIEKIAFEMYIQSEYKASHEPSDFLVKALFDLCLSQHHVLCSWKAETPKPHLFAEPLETLNTFILLCVSEESRHPCCLLETRQEIRSLFSWWKK